MLTQKQREVLVFIESFMSAHGIPPSVREISDGTGHKGSSNVHRMMNCLEERGYIKRLRNRARALEVIKPITKPDPWGRNETQAF